MHREVVCYAYYHDYGNDYYHNYVANNHNFHFARRLEDARLAALKKLESTKGENEKAFFAACEENNERGRLTSKQSTMTPETRPRVGKHDSVLSKCCPQVESAIDGTCVEYPMHTRLMKLCMGTSCAHCYAVPVAHV